MRGVWCVVCGVCLDAWRGGCAWGLRFECLGGVEASTVYDCLVGKCTLMGRGEDVDGCVFLEVKEYIV